MSTTLTHPPRRVRTAFSSIWRPPAPVGVMRSPLTVVLAPRRVSPQRRRSRSPSIRLSPAASGHQPGPALLPPPNPDGAVRIRLLGRTLDLNPRIALLLVPFLWGSLPAVYKLRGLLPWAVTAATFNALRLLLSFLCVSGTLRRELKDRKPDSSSLLLGGAELGLWTYLASTCQLIAVNFTSASRAAFLAQLQMIFVPILAALSGDRSALNAKTFTASAVALTGVACLTLDSAAAPLTLAGDGTMIVGACVAAMLVLRTRAVAVKLRSGPLVAYRVCAQFICAMAFLLGAAAFHWASGSATSATAMASAGFFSGATPLLLLANVAIVVWSGAIVSFGSTWLHVKANTVVPATESAIIFSFTPLWASVFAMFLGERFGIKGVIGAALIVLSTLMSSNMPSAKKKGVAAADVATN